MIVKIIYYFVVIYVHDKKKILDEKRILSGISRETSQGPLTRLLPIPLPIRLPVLFKTCEDTSPTIILGRRLGGTTRPIFK
jgi:hypothetical protein